MIAGLASALAVAAIVGATLLQSRHSSSGIGRRRAVTKPRAGAPPLILDLGVRDDPEARALDRAAALYGAGHREQAGRIFARYHSLDAQIGAAFAAWPDGGLDTLKQLVASHPHSALAELHLGYAYYWSGRNADAVGAWRQAVKVEPDSSAAVSAADLLHPSFVAPGCRSSSRRSSPRAPSSRCRGRRSSPRSRAPPRRPDANAKLLYGIALWNLRRPLSAERQFRAAASLAPNDPMALTAAAVGSFSKARPVLAFSQLGPLTGRFPRSASSASTSACSSSGRTRWPRRGSSSGSRSRSSPVPVCCAGEKTTYSSWCHWDQAEKMMSRTAHGATSDPHGTVRHPKKHGLGSARLR